MSSKKVGIIGIGNAGNQVAYLAESSYPELFGAVYINSSESDLAQAGPSKFKFKIGEGVLEGSGKNRTKMKEYLKADIGELLGNEEFKELIVSMKYVYIIASAAGGTGSGASPMLLDIMREYFVDVNFILVTILPDLGSGSLMEQGNARELLDEVQRNLVENTTYMVYDNDTASDLSSTMKLKAVNEAIVEDLVFLTGVKNYPSPYETIDEADLEGILTTPGRLVVARVSKGLTEKNLEDIPIDDFLIKALKNSRHAELNRDRKTIRWGIITHFTEDVNKLYSSNLEKLAEFVGTPVERFNHNSVNDLDDSQNFITLILSGQPLPTDRINKIDEKADALKKALDAAKTSGYVASSENPTYAIMEEKKRAAAAEKSSEPLNLESIYNKY